MPHSATVAAFVVLTTALVLLAARSTRGRRARRSSHRRWQDSLAQHGALPCPPHDDETRT